MSVHITEKQLAQAKEFVEKCHQHGDLAPVDIDRFWQMDRIAHSDPWAENCPQVPLGIRMGPECVFAEMNEKEDWYKFEHDYVNYRTALCRRYNDLSEKIVGRRLIYESIPDPQLQWPLILALHDIFEAKNQWEGMSYWLSQSANTPDELKSLLDRVEKRLENLREFILPETWEKEKIRITRLGGKVPIYREQRGPVTFAMSIYGVENLIFLIADDPDLAVRFRDLILKSILIRAQILDEEAGFTPDNAPHGFYWCDDNCAMLNAEMYELFGFPILQKVFSRYSPNPKDPRGQHSDSDMGHLLPLLGKLKLTTVNFGPNLKLSDIRNHLPHAVICGQLAPFTFSRNEEVNMIAEFLRDFEMARFDKGLMFTTAGSINNGSRLSSMRMIMAAIQEFGKY